MSERSYSHPLTPVVCAERQRWYLVGALLTVGEKAEKVDETSGNTS